MNPVSAWHEEHAYFNRLLAFLRAQLDVFHGGERPNFDLILDVLSYLKDYGDEVHHPREDAAFELLSRRCPDLRLTLARLRQDHRVLEQSGVALREQLEAILEDALVRREDVEAALATYLVYYGNHIAREEEEILGRAAQALGPDDWRAVEAAAPAATAAGERYRRMRRQIALDS